MPECISDLCCDFACASDAGPLLHTLSFKQLDQLSYCILRHNITFMYCTEVQPSVSLHLPISHVKPDSEIQFCQIIYTNHWIQCRLLERLLSLPTNFNCILDISSLMSTLKSTNRDYSRHNISTLFSTFRV